jgi:hypothetical protein
MALIGKRRLSEESLTGNLEMPQTVTVPNVRIGSMIQASEPSRRHNRVAAYGDAVEVAHLASFFGMPMAFDQGVMRMCRVVGRERW